MLRCFLLPSCVYSILILAYTVPTISGMIVLQKNKLFCKWARHSETPQFPGKRSRLAAGNAFHSQMPSCLTCLSLQHLEQVRQAILDGLRAKVAWTSLRPHCTWPQYAWTIFKIIYIYNYIYIYKYTYNKDLKILQMTSMLYVLLYVNIFQTIFAALQSFAAGGNHLCHDLLDVRIRLRIRIGVETQDRSKLGGLLLPS